MNTLVTKKTEQGDIVVDVFQELAGERILFITGEIDPSTSADISATLLLKDSEDPTKKISLFINSTGGNIRDILAIYDVMNVIESPIETICIGAACRESVLLLAAGTPGMRFATKNCTIMVEQLSNDYTKLSDMTEAKISLQQSLDDNKRLMEALAKITKNPLKDVIKKFDRQVYMTSNEAQKYGLIDKVITQK